MEELTRNLDRHLHNHSLSFGSDPALARAIVESQRMAHEEGLAVSTGGSLFIFDGAVWNRLKHGSLISLAAKLDGQYLPCDPPKRLSISMAKADSVARMTLFLPEIKKDNFFDKVPMGVVAKNGFWTVDEWSVDMLDHSPEHRATWGYQFEIEPEGQPTNWLKFLDSLWRDDADKEGKKKALQEWLGCCLIGRSPDYARALMFIGAGGNGKSILMKAIEGLFPEETVTSASPKRWDQEYTVASLRDSRINLCGELPTTFQRLDSSDTFKSVIAGDRVTGREPYAPTFSFIPRCGHVFSANALPGLASGDYSEGFWRRFLLLEFNRSFTSEYALERRDPSDILEEISKEQASIVYWALHGACRLLKQGAFTLPPSHQGLLEQWHIDSDPVKDFVVACCEKGESPLSSLFNDYQDFCTDTGRRAGSTRTLAKRLRALGHESKHTNKGTVFDVQTRTRLEWANHPL